MPFLARQLLADLADRRGRQVGKPSRFHAKCGRTHFPRPFPHGILGFGSVDGATDTDTFLVFVRDGLVPNLKAGQVVVLDNLPAHKSPKIDELIESAGARVMRLPPYSPDYNPIEMAISKGKSILRRLARRTVDALLKSIAEAMDSITAADAINFIRHCGYAATSK
jgi:transposase